MNERSEISNRLRSTNGASLLFIVSILLISALLGGGLVWLYGDYRYDQAMSRLRAETLKVQTYESKIDLHRNVETTLQDILLLAEKYQKAFGAHLKDASTGESDQLVSLQEELDELKRQYRLYERKLAEIENRTPRPVDLVFEFAAAD